MTPNTEHRTPNVIVVGSGISGLSAAIVLALHGRRPLVLEAHNIAGGCMQMFARRAPGGELCRFDTGVHYVGSLYPGQLMWRLFRYLGIDVPTQPLRRECLDRISLPGGDFKVPVGWDAVGAAMRGQCPAEGAAIDGYIATMKRVEGSLNWHALDPDVEGAYDRELYDLTIDGLLQRLGASPRLRSLALAQSSLYGAPADRTPLAIHAPVVGSAIEGPHYVVGGGDAITKPLVARLRELGGELRARADVARVLVEGGRVSGVELADGEVLHADEVILALHPHAAARLMPDDAWRSELRRRLERAPECVGLFCVYGIAQGHEAYAGSNHYLLRDDDPDCFYRPGLDGPADAIVNLPPGNPQLISAMSSARMEWFDKWQGTHTPRKDPEYRALKQRLTDNVLAMIAQRMPGLRVTVVESATPLTLRDYARYPGGGIYGLEPGIDAQGRNGVRRRTRYAGLYVTGAGTGTPGILGACVTGFAVAGSILGTQALIREVRTATDPTA
ncbi:MAG: NAD(P)/FAD-dependent oxidoreductase [Planctomycetes bacterium]|nr:NAD(P)/FAD-dependent oxidoreductase [Planctomycetota bacterium]MCW8134272.1 NAD(P)/FAD-dependent oxidoreductase [Planctomycetota bacterium]